MEVPPLTKAELQKTLLHLIEVIFSRLFIVSSLYDDYDICSFQHDDDFLSYVHSAYMQTHSRNIS